MEDKGHCEVIAHHPHNLTSFFLGIRSRIEIEIEMIDFLWLRSYFVVFNSVHDDATSFQILYIRQF